MIEGNLRPINRDMAIAALGAVTTFMHVVIAMTGRAFCRRRCVILIDMTSIAARGLVTTRQLKPRTRVIEANESPVSCIVAIATGLAQRTRVYIVVAMASHAVRVSVPVRCIADMTGVAFRVGMSPEQCEIGETVIERVRFKKNDLRIASLVIGVTACAIAVTGPRVAAVVTAA